MNLLATALFGEGAFLHSRVCYRVYDWDRVDASGNSRDLHNDLAIDAINFNMKDNFRVDYSKIKNVANTLVNCSYFTTNYLPIDSEILLRENTFDSFIIYMCVEGEATISTIKHSETIKKGETILLPAIIKSFKIEAETAVLLEVYVQTFISGKN